VFVKHRSCHIDNFQDGCRVFARVIPEKYIKNDHLTLAHHLQRLLHQPGSDQKPTKLPRRHDKSVSICTKKQIVTLRFCSFLLQTDKRPQAFSINTLIQLIKSNKHHLGITIA
jgi:hypothetical protein